MAGIDSEKIIQDLNRRFAAPLPEFYKRRIIFWYDEDREFEDKISDIALNDAKILILTGCESLAAGILVTLTMIFVFRLSVPFSLLLGAIGCATAPASTIMTIRQYHAKGPFVNIILQVVALDDAVSLIAFSVCTAISRHLGSLNSSQRAV